MEREALVFVFLLGVCYSKDETKNRTHKIILPIIGIAFAILIIAIICWKKLSRPRRLICAYNHPQVAYITQANSAPPIYRLQTSTFEQPPPPYHRVVGPATMSQVKC